MNDPKGAWSGSRDLLHSADHSSLDFGLTDAITCLHPLLMLLVVVSIAVKMLTMFLRLSSCDHTQNSAEHRRTS